jgi:hypothetical protein
MHIELHESDIGAAIFGARMYFHRTIVAVGLCLLLAGIASADVTSQRWQLSLIRGSTTLETPSAATEAEVWAKCAARVAELSETGNPSTVYICQTLRYYATAVSTCQPAPAPQTKSMSCPAGTTGSWKQTSVSTVTPAPGCNVTAGPWLPTAAPVDACVVVTVGTATLSWTPPTKNIDGSALTNLAGYRISYGTSPTALVQVVQIANPGASSYVLDDLSPGTYFFTVRAYVSTGTESAQTPVVSKTIL